MLTSTAEIAIRVDSGRAVFVGSKEDAIHLAGCILEVVLERNDWAGFETVHSGQNIEVHPAEECDRDHYESMKRTLQSTVGLIEDATNTKIHTGRLPRVGHLLSTILDGAIGTLAEAGEETEEEC